MSRQNRTLAVVAVLTLAISATVAEDQIFFNFGNLQGDSTDQNHGGWIDAYALDEAYSRPPQAGSATLDDIAILKGTDRSTPELIKHLIQAISVPTATIDVCRPGPPQECYYRIELDGARIHAFNLAGSACVDAATSCTPTQTESVTISFDKIRWIYTPYTNGNPDPTVEYCWDDVQKQPC